MQFSWKIVLRVDRADSAPQAAFRPQSEKEWRDFRPKRWSVKSDRRSIHALLVLGRGSLGSVLLFDS